MTSGRKRIGFDGLSDSTKKRFPKKELIQHVKAYHVYKNMLPAERTYKAVAEIIGVTTSSIAIWAQAFNWDDRIGEFEQMVSDEVIAKKKDLIKSIREETINQVEEIIREGSFEDGADLKNLIDAAQRAIGMGKNIREGSQGDKKDSGRISIGKAVLLIDK
jgi:Zn-dependent M16 (insulinase) family peptidase